MPIKFHCPHCSAPVKAPETHAGQTLPCPKCGQPVVVVADPEPSAAAPTPPAFPPAARPEPVDEFPEIVTRDTRASGAAPPPATSPPSADAYAAPQTRSDRVIDAEFENIRIVDLNLPFRSVLKFAVQFFVCNMVLLGIVYGVVFVFIVLFAMLFRSMSFAP